jgi:hypothetical protein
MWGREEFTGREYSRGGETVYHYSDSLISEWQWNRVICAFREPKGTGHTYKIALPAGIEMDSFSVDEVRFDLPRSAKIIYLGQSGLATFGESEGDTKNWRYDNENE